MNYNAYRARVQKVSDEYERLTGKQGLLYVSRPGDGQARYVFGDAVKLGGSAALDYITTELGKAKR